MRIGYALYKKMGFEELEGSRVAGRGGHVGRHGTTAEEEEMNVMGPSIGRDKGLE